MKYKDWPCPDNCIDWCRLNAVNYITNHHERCKYYNSSLINVWKVSFDGNHYYTDKEPSPNDFSEGEIITEETMHQEVYEQLPEFNGF